MFVMPKSLRDDYEKWRKANPVEAAKQDKEWADAMTQLEKASVKKYGKQANGCIRIDSKMFTTAIEGMGK